MENEISKTTVSNIAQGEELAHQYRDMSLQQLNELLENKRISKNQKKKIAKQIKWLECSDKRKEHRKKRKLRYKEMRKNIPEGTCPKRKKIEKICTSESFGELYHIAVDLTFEHLMTNKDVRKLGKQIGWCYKENRRSLSPVQYHLCGLQGRLKSALDPSYVNWDVHFDKNVSDAFSSDKIVYLTAESPNVLSQVEIGKVYVIGGLVDHNHQKGICQKLAEENKFMTAHLPLGENIDMKTRKVLTINHVFEILLAYCESKDWKSAILKVLPSKKFVSGNEKDKSSLTPTINNNNNNASTKETRPAIPEQVQPTNGDSLI